jgi:hypothetical protein
LVGGIVGGMTWIGGDTLGGEFPPTGVEGRVDISSRPSRRSSRISLFLFLSGFPSKNHLLIVVLRSIDCPLTFTLADESTPCRDVLGSNIATITRSTSLVRKLGQFSQAASGIELHGMGYEPGAPIPVPHGALDPDRLAVVMPSPPHQRGSRRFLLLADGLRHFLEHKHDRLVRGSAMPTIRPLWRGRAARIWAGRGQAILDVCPNRRKSLVGLYP